MGWFILEGLLALALAVLIVWWTMSGRHERDAADDAPRPSSDDHRRPDT